MEKELLEAQLQLELRVKERTRELEKAHNNLRTLSGKVLRLQDEERKRIGRELHDSAGQTLAVLAMNLSQLEQSANNGSASFTEKLKETQELLQRVTQEIRTTSYLLHPPLLDEIGFVAALKLYVDGLTQRTTLKIDLDVSGELGSLPKELELAMFRTVQECLTNILRHAESDVAEIRVRRTAEKLILEVQDNGKGISKEKLAEINENRTGVGIRGMRDRVRAFNGDVKVYSTGPGTTVSITFPIGDSNWGNVTDTSYAIDAERTSQSHWKN
jgi:signal transduction histidine kinase